MIRTLAAAIAMIGVAAPVSAANFSFTSNDNSFNPFTFSIATSPTPDAFDAATFDIDAVSTTEAGQFGPLVYDADYRFYTGASGGGFENGFVAYVSAQMFGGTTAAPTFYNGSYDLSDFIGGSVVATLIISDAATAPSGAVPEPETWAMMTLGFGLVGVALRRRRKPIAA